MRPGDTGMSSIIVQQVARQALATFRSLGRVGEAGRSLPEQQSKLRALLTEVRAADLRLVEPRAADTAQQHPYHHQQPPVTYMHIYETDEFSMGVFLLKRGASIPLHDHPGMHGMLKVMYGTARITCYDRLDRAPTAGGEPPSSPPPSFQKGSLRRSVLRSTGEYTEHSGPCVLAPHRDNLHRIDAVDGPTAFLDILAPPYEPDDGRDCHYYQVMPEEAKGGAERAQTETTPAAPGHGPEMWLMEIAQPPEFWCGSEPYHGPEVCL